MQMKAVAPNAPPAVLTSSSRRSLACAAAAVPSVGRPDAQVVTVLGTQWGDEGKGKLVDILARDFDVVARAQVRWLEKEKRRKRGWKEEGVEVEKKKKKLPT